MTPKDLTDPELAHYDLILRAYDDAIHLNTPNQHFRRGFFAALILPACLSTPNPTDRTTP